MTIYTLRCYGDAAKKDLMERCGGVFPDWMEGKPDDGTREITILVDCEESDLSPEFSQRQFWVHAIGFGASRKDADELRSLLEASPK